MPSIAQAIVLASYDGYQKARWGIHILRLQLTRFTTTSLLETNHIFWFVADMQWNLVD